MSTKNTKTNTETKKENTKKEKAMTEKEKAKATFDPKVYWEQTLVPNTVNWKTAVSTQTSILPEYIHKTYIAPAGIVLEQDAHYHWGYKVFVKDEYLGKVWFKKDVRRFHAHTSKVLEDIDIGINFQERFAIKNGVTSKTEVCLTQAELNRLLEALVKKYTAPKPEKAPKAEKPEKAPKPEKTASSKKTNAKKGSTK